MKLKAALVATIVAALALISASAQGSTAATVSKKTHHLLVCTKSYDPYREPIALLRSCGDVILRLEHVTPLPSGGKAYDYGAYTQFVPPPHFNVVKASDRQLQEYGLPTRQRFGSRWYGLVRHMRHFARPVPYLVAIPSARKTASPVPSLANCSEPCSFNWEGYVANTGHTYTGASAEWYEPDFVSDSCTTTDLAQWVGIGGYNGSNDLGQDGTIFGYPNAGSHQAWIEANDPSGSIVPVGLYATKDQKFAAVTTWDSSATKYDYAMVNDYTDETWSGESRSVGGNNDLSSAEVITERTTNGGGNGGFYDLTDFQNFQVLNADVLADGTWDGIYKLVNLNNPDATLLDMVDSPNGTNLMAFPGSINSNSNFTNTWNHCN